MSAAVAGGMRLVEVPFGVRGADQPVATPRDDEEHALLGAQEQAELRRETVPRHHEVDALAGPHLELAALAHHGLGLIRPDPGRVDDLLGQDLEVLVGLQVVRFHADDALADLDEALDLHPARDVRAVEARGAGEVRDVASVVDLRVPVGEAAGEGIGMQAGHRPQELPLGEVAMMRHARRPEPGVAEQVVERHAGADVEALEERLRQRVEEPHGLHQVRCDPLQQQAAFDEGLAHQAEVELLEVADASVHELGAAAAGAGRPVARLQHPDAQAARDGVERRTGADDAAADDEDVELLLAHVVQSGLALVAGRACSTG